MSLSVSNLFTKSSVSLIDTSAQSTSPPPRVTSPSHREDDNAAHHRKRSSSLSSLMSLFALKGGGNHVQLEENGGERGPVSLPARLSGRKRLPSPLRTSSPPPEGPLPEPEEIYTNPFYIALQKTPVLQRVAVLLVPHSQSLVELNITKDLLQTHSLVPSPYYKGQFLSMNGKTVLAEKKYVQGIEGFKRSRKVRIVTEVLVYSNNYRPVRVLIIDRPLEGNSKPLPQELLTVPHDRNSENDFEFLKGFSENARALKTFQSAISAFNENYIYVRGYTSFAVDRIMQIFERLVEDILRDNSRLNKVCRVASEHEHFLELVENVVMAQVHNKIFAQSLVPMFVNHDSYIDSIIRIYNRKATTLRGFNVDEELHGIPLAYFSAAISQLRRFNDASVESSERDFWPTLSLELESEDVLDPVVTPREKLMCVKKCLDEISRAVERYMSEIRPGDPNLHDYVQVTSDDFIPLLSFIVVRARVAHLVSHVYHMERFRLAKTDRPELGFALVTLQASLEYLKSDPLGLHDSSTTSSVSSMVSTAPIPMRSPIQPHPTLRIRTATSYSPGASTAAISSPHLSPPTLFSLSPRIRTTSLTSAPWSGSGGFANLSNSVRETRRASPSGSLGRQLGHRRCRSVEDVAVQEGACQTPEHGKKGAALSADADKPVSAPSTTGKTFPNVPDETTPNEPASKDGEAEKQARMEEHDSSRGETPGQKDTPLPKLHPTSHGFTRRVGLRRGIDSGLGRSLSTSAASSPSLMNATAQPPMRSVSASASCGAPEVISLRQPLPPHTTLPPRAPLAKRSTWQPLAGRRVNLEKSNLDVKILENIGEDAGKVRDELLGEFLTSLSRVEGEVCGDGSGAIRFKIR
ncbi:uncharacterized protein VTP21DRAFT_4920 [Calcarisporiella thermophila]|uniref:uncharacterized protein n=1 Tax=Calcarisporiella thermophila TaxID=911321 RepID=UPI0037437EA8